MKFDANVFIEWLFHFFDNFSEKCLFRPIWVGGFIPKCGRILPNIRKAHPWPETHILSYRSSWSIKKLDLGA